MNTQLPTKSQPPAKAALLAKPSKAASQPAPGKADSNVANLSLRYPKDLEHCFVLGNN
ncbi:hypothetical protein [Microbulbifer sp. Q7]|uniref:hypothetical protein n=1 Tax=Microbulbifer sp. Q7 TaxID=1785091 RepID=UPI000AC119C0|nr:hypothetical protein [Microbulbifer sp. Q7]